jgi:hypothetical protein
VVGVKVKDTVRAVVEIVIVWLAVAVLELPSVAVMDTVKVPAALYVVVKLDPVPDAGEPPVAVHANEYGAVPPVADAVNVTAVPTDPVVGPVMEAASASGEMVINADFVADTELPSVIVTETVYDPLVL